jgi:D-sedoheptulose 7-phosphate isomerase
LAGTCHEAICVDAASTATVQEIHLMLIHGLCMALDDVLLRREAS